MGWLLLDDDTTAWAPKWHRGVAPVDLRGAQPQGVDVGAHNWRLRPSDTALRLRLPDGAELQVAVTDEDLPLIEQAFRDTHGAPPVGRSRKVGRQNPPAPWALTLLALIALELVIGAWIALAGGWVDAMTTAYSHTNDRCKVSWTSGDGDTRTRTVDCDQYTAAGATIRVFVPPAPLEFAADRGDVFPFYGAVLLLPVALPVGLYFAPRVFGVPPRRPLGPIDGSA